MFEVIMLAAMLVAAAVAAGVAFLAVFMFVGWLMEKCPWLP